MTIKAVKEKKEVYPIYPISDWGVEKYGVTLYVNNHSLRYGMKDGVALDVEDDEQGNFVGLGIYEPSSNSVYYWSDFNLAKEVAIPKFVAHNGVSDLTKLQKWGFKVDESCILWDTMLMEHVLDSSKHTYGLKALISDLGINYPHYDDIVGKKTKKQIKPRITLDKQPLELVANYCSMDCYSTYKLYEDQMRRLNDKAVSLNYHNQIELPASFVFQKMSHRGIRVDLPYLNELKALLEPQREAVKGSILSELGEINLNSPKQLLEALNAKGVTPVMKGKGSTDKRALEAWRAKPVVESLLKYSELDTLLTSFVYPYLERNSEFVHPKFLQVGTRTGRLSCSNPNLLQIPKRSDNGKLVRRMFIPRNGYLFGDCDFGNIEPRLLAHFSKDPVLCEMFNSGVDFHTYTADRLSISRDRAKILNLSVGYRATFKSVSQQLKCSPETAQKEIDKWWSLFPSLYDWQQALIHVTKQTGYCTTLMGRRIKVDNLTATNPWTREAAERQLINNLCQASAAEIMKLAMIEVDKAKIDILVQVYDEILFESPECNISSDIEIVIDKMINACKLIIPITVKSKIGNNWSECS